MVNIVWIYLGFSPLFTQLKSDFSLFSHHLHNWPPKVLYYTKQCNMTGLNSQWSTCLIVETSKHSNIYRGRPSQACAHQARCCLHRWWLSLIIFVSVCGWTFMCELCETKEELVFISQGRGEGTLHNPPDPLHHSSRQTSAHYDQDDLQMRWCRHCSSLPGGKQPPCFISV